MDLALAAIAERSHAATLILQAALARPVSVTKPGQKISFEVERGQGGKTSAVNLTQV